MDISKFKDPVFAFVVATHMEASGQRLIIGKEVDDNLFVALDITGNYSIYYDCEKWDYSKACSIMELPTLKFGIFHSESLNSIEEAYEFAKANFISKKPGKK